MTVVETGEVFTRRWIAEFMLNMAGYRGNISRLTVVEPSIGGGAFLVPIVERLIAAKAPWETLHNSIRGYDLQPQSVELCKNKIRNMLDAAGCPISDELVNSWLHTRDFLLTGDLFDETSLQADLVIGNPPYIRMENLDPQLLAAYRQAYPTMKGRADIFVGFFERGLNLLKPGGRLVFICADRWMRNSYGKALRSKVIDGFSMDDVLVMHDVDAFEDKVSAYPAIVNIRKGKQGKVNVATASASFAEADAQAYLAWRESAASQYQNDSLVAARMDRWHDSSSVWPDGTPEDLRWLSQLSDMPLIELDDVTLGIGIATGADKVYISTDADVEADRLVPMVTPGAIKGKAFSWTGENLVSPWQGRNLVELSKYPHLERYYLDHQDLLRKRNVAQRSQAWWRTIDSFNPALLSQDLLVMQDMKLHAHPVRVPAGYYPHHGLTWFSSTCWNLDTLGGLLLSEPVEKQVAAYCVRMRGGTLRFQPTVMRMVRLPKLSDIPADVADELAEAFRTYDRKRASEEAWKLYPVM